VGGVSQEREATAESRSEKFNSEQCERQTERNAQSAGFIPVIMVGVIVTHFEEYFDGEKAEAPDCTSS